MASWITLAERISIVGFALVILGVIGEGCEIAAKWAARRKRLKEVFDGEYRRLILSIVWRIRHHELEYETLFFILVVLGLAIELGASSAAMILQGKDNAILHDRAAKLEFKMLPRWKQLPITEFRSLLKGRPTGRALILFVPDDDEAEGFAIELERELSESGWTSEYPRPIPPNMVSRKWRLASPNSLKRESLQQRATGTSGPITLTSRKHGLFFDEPTAIGAMGTALMQTGFSPMSNEDEDLPDQLFFEEAMEAATNPNIDRSSLSNTLVNADKSFMSNWVVVVIGRKE